MGEYAPDDQRDVHTATNADWREAEENSDSNDRQAEAQMGYGNARCGRQQRAGRNARRPVR